MTFALPYPRIPFQLNNSQILVIQKWTIDESGLLWLNDWIFIPDVLDCRLKVLQYKHDHVLAGHFGFNKTLEAAYQEYVWPNLCTFVQDFCKSCTT
jgi:Integrase zinc binding domain